MPAYKSDDNDGDGKDDDPSCCAPSNRVGAVGLGGTNLPSMPMGFNLTNLNVTRCCEACDRCVLIINDNDHQ
jgi:hypothetical protein